MDRIMPPPIASSSSSSSSSPSTSAARRIPNRAASASRCASNDDVLPAANDEIRTRRRHQRELSRRALYDNDAMVYLDGPNVYGCGNCRTHLTSHDDIISKSFHGRHGRAYLFDQCVNVITGPSEERMLMTGLHTVSDISCKRCRTLIGWTYSRAYDISQKYKEGKYIIEKVHLHLEEGDDVYAGIGRPAGERGDRWSRTRSISWGSGGGSREERSASFGSYGEVVTSLSSSVSSSSTYPRHPSSPRTPIRHGPVGVGSTIMTTTSTPSSPISPGGIIHEYPM